MDAVARADDGLGLTALARASGLAKTSAHRLAEQLVTLGAVQCDAHRYYVGPRMLPIGQRWQPDPLLRCFAQAPVHSLAVRSRATASLRILHEHRLRYICAAAPHGHAYMPDLADPESIARTATGRVLYATQPPGESRFLIAGPDANGATCATPCAIRARQWSTIRTRLPASVAYQRPCGGRVGPAPAQSPSRSTQTTSPSAYPPWCRTPRAASAPPFGN